MGQRSPMAAQRDPEEGRRGVLWTPKKDNGWRLVKLVGVTEWSRGNARRAIAAPAVRRKTRAPTFEDDTLKVLIHMWTLGRGAVRDVPGPASPHRGPAGGPSVSRVRSLTGSARRCVSRCPCVVAGQQLIPRRFSRQQHTHGIETRERRQPALLR